MSVTIAIPIYNAEEFLASAIQSVLNQTYRDFELILLDDGSTDASLEVARSFKDSRIRVISDGENLGLPARLNQITELATYDLIARMDADDLIPNYRIEIQVNYLKSKLDIDLVSMGMAYFDGDTYYGHTLPGTTRHKLTLNDLESGNSGICHATLMVRKSWYLRNKYNAKAERIEDFELWLRSFKKNDLAIGFIDRVGYYYRSDNTLTFSKYLKVNKSFFKLFSGAYNYHSFRLRPLIYNCFKFILVSLVFLMRKQNKLLSMKNRSLKSTAVCRDFNSQFINVKVEVND